ncbi:protein S40-6-like [Actinidia eriantha]|uniref:protein S40-6-like n=1 Tax=Actinidia eriantha TaxID=165200 RepID=UPI00258BB759|nr:protein S40-6-like [Actinidia eriantha]
MEGRYGWRSWKNEEFQEEDVWAVMRENFTTSKAESSTTISPRRLPSAAKLIPRDNKNSSTTQQEPKMVQQSAHVNVPDWSKIYGNSSKKGSNGVINGNWDSDDDDDDDDDGDGDGGKMMPPHEWIARKHDRSEVCCFSVCEGAGRTLKGRDLRRVRHAVLTRTGFLG